MTFTSVARTKLKPDAWRFYRGDPDGKLFLDRIGSVGLAQNCWMGKAAMTTESWPPQFIFGSQLQIEENEKFEFKAVGSAKPVRTIVNVAEDYIVSFLNAEGGRILWGITDDRIVEGVSLNVSQRDEIRKGLASKIHDIQPPIDPSCCRWSFHAVEGADSSSNLCIVEIVIDRVLGADPYFNHSGEAFIRLNGVSQKLKGPKLTGWIKTRLARRTGAVGTIDDPKIRGLVTRVRQIFEKHGLEPTHLARFFEVQGASFSIDLTDLETDGALLRWLDERKIDWISKCFLVRREWIDGEDDQILEKFYFDKQPEHFFSTISQHLDALVFQEVNEPAYAYFLRNGVGKEWKSKGEQTVFVVLAVPLARFSNERTAYKYVTDLNPYPWDYGRCHIQLRAWARLLNVSKGVHCFGKSIPIAAGERLSNNQVFLRDVIENELGHERDWHPEDYALYPGESVQAKATETLPHVIEFLKKNSLPWKETNLGPPRK